MQAVEAAPAELLCGGCGYNLHGISSNRCPECGRRFDPEHLIDRLIPFERRRYIGLVRGFWQTAWMATFHPRQLAARRLNKEDAHLNIIFSLTANFC